eukprot:s1004_g8.t1
MLSTIIHLPFAEFNDILRRITLSSNLRATFHDDSPLPMEIGALHAVVVGGFGRALKGRQSMHLGALGANMVLLCSLLMPLEELVNAAACDVHCMRCQKFGRLSEMNLLCGGSPCFFQRLFGGKVTCPKCVASMSHTCLWNGQIALNSCGSLWCGMSCFEQWYSTIDPLMATYFETFFATNAARDYVVRCVYGAAPLGAVDLSSINEGFRKIGTPLANEHIGGAGPIGGRKLLSACGALPMTPYEEDVYASSPEAQKHEVCAFLMLRRELRQQERCGVDILTFDLQPHKAAHVIGKLVQTVHRYRLFSTSGDVAVRKLRKAQACIKRSDPADWESLAPVFFGFQSLRVGVGDGNDWMGYLQQHASIAAEVADEMVRSLPVRIKEEKPSQFFQEMLYSQPTGSTTSGASAIERIGDNRITEVVDITKAISAAVMSFEEFEQLLEKPAVALVRCISKKGEPGNPRRDLQALDDVSTMIESFAARGLENNRKCCGFDLAMLQDRKSTTSFLGDALKNDGTGRFNSDGQQSELYLSADISKYNESESIFEQFAIACGFMWAFKRIGNLRKAHCWAWVSRALWMSFISKVEGRSDYWYAGWRILNRLLSGRRTTMLLNTVNHICYIRMIQKQVSFFLRREVSLSGHLAGDDEILKFLMFIIAFFFSVTQQYQGHKLNFLKLLAGSVEFLQKLVDHCEPWLASQPHEVMRPLATVISSFASGNWYSAKHIALEDPISAASSVCQQMILRGADAIRVRHYLAAALDLRMSAFDGNSGEYIDLEWRHLAFANAGAWIWNVDEKSSARSAAMMPPVEPILQGFPQAAIQDCLFAFLNQFRLLLQLVPTRLVKQLEQNLTDAVLAPAARTERGERKLELTIRKFPRRGDNRPQLPFENMVGVKLSLEQQLQICQLSTTRIGLDEVEQWEALRVPRTLAQALVSSGITAGAADSTTSALFGPPPPLGEWTTVPVVAMGAESEVISHWALATTVVCRVVVYLCAHAGAGKTYLVNKLLEYKFKRGLELSGFVALEADSILAAGFNVRAELRYRDEACNWAEQLLLKAAGYQYSLVVGQLHPHLLQRVAQRLGLRVVTVGLMTDREVLAKRIEQRNVSERMKDIWNAAYDQQNVLSTVSKIC